MSKRNRPSFQDRSHLPPSRDPDLKTDYIGMVFQVIEDQFSGLISILRGPLSEISYTLRSSSLLIYLIWLGCFLFPLWENATFMATYPQSLAILPIFMGFVIMFSSAFNIPFTLNSRIPRWFWNLLLFPLPFLKDANVSGKENRPYWVCLALWDGILLFWAAFQINHFTLGIATPIMLVMSFCSVLFR